MDGRTRARVHARVSMHYMQTTCTLHVHYMYTTCTLHVNYMQTTGEIALEIARFSLTHLRYPFTGAFILISSGASPRDECHTMSIRALIWGFRLSSRTAAAEPSFSCGSVGPVTFEGVCSSEALSDVPLPYQ